MKYILIGTPNVGKSTIGKQAADELKLSFYDIDKIAAERIPFRSPLDMFNSRFLYRIISEQVNILNELAQKDEDAVIAVGAMLPKDGGCADILPNIGKVIHITRNFDTARADAMQQGGLTLVQKDNDGKPVPVINMSARAVEEYASDLPLLKSIADFTVENDGDINEGADKLVALIQSIKET